MAKVSMLDDIEGKGKSDSSSTLRYKLEQEEKIRKHYLEKFNGDELKAKKATAKALERIDIEENKKSLDRRKQFWAEEMKYGATAAERWGASMKIATANAVKNATSAALTSVERYIGIYDQYMSGIEARIQGSGKTFQGMVSTISGAIGSSQYVSQVKVLERLNSLVEQGIVYNVEQRAFLGTISEKIAKTFDVANGTLLQLIRIQQADSTAARLGMEAYLTQFFNAQFRDTSYMNKASSISSNLLGISSQLGRNRSVELEYVAQKWLGSMSSVGVSDSTIQSLAQGLNYLGTGDISGLSSNQSLQRLLVAASSRAGLDFGSLLTGGVDATTANKLFSSIIRLGQDIARTDNMVVKSQYANLFGMTISDLTSLLNLSSKDLVSISNNMLSYAGAISEVENQLTKVPSRMHLSERINTMFENMMTTTGMSIANNAVSYTTWIITDLIEKATGGINIPTISVMGNAVDLNATVTQLMKLGIIGANVLGNIGTIVSGLSGRNNLSLYNWGAEDILKRGQGFTGITIGSAQTTSETTYIGSTSSSDIYQSSLASAQESANVDIQGTQKKAEDQQAELLEAVKGLYKLFDETFRYGDSVRVISSSINNPGQPISSIIGA